MKKKSMDGDRMADSWKGEKRYEKSDIEILFSASYFFSFP